MSRAITLIIFSTFLFSCKPSSAPADSVDYKKYRMKADKSQPDGTTFKNGGIFHMMGNGKLRYKWTQGPAWIDGTYSQDGDIVTFEFSKQEYKGVGGKFTFKETAGEFKVMNCAIAVAKVRRKKDGKFGEWQAKGLIAEQREPKCVDGPK